MQDPVENLRLLRHKPHLFFVLYYAKLTVGPERVPLTSEWQRFELVR